MNTFLFEDLLYTNQEKEFDKEYRTKAVELIFIIYFFTLYKIISLWKW